MTVEQRGLHSLNGCLLQVMDTQHVITHSGPLRFRFGLAEREIRLHRGLERKQTPVYLADVV